MNAIVEIAGKQFSIEKDAQLKVPKLNEEPGKKINFDKVLMMTKSGETKLGSPYLNNATFSAEVLSHGKEKKVVVFKMKRRKGYQKKQGHKQEYTLIKILD